jgi:hypothetical protein
MPHRPRRCGSHIHPQRRLSVAFLRRQGVRHFCQGCIACRPFSPLLGCLLLLCVLAAGGILQLCSGLRVFRGHVHLNYISRPMQFYCVQCAKWMHLVVHTLQPRNLRACMHGCVVVHLSMCCCSACLPPRLSYELGFHWRLFLSKVDGVQHYRPRAGRAACLCVLYWTML